MSLIDDIQAAYPTPMIAAPGQDKDDSCYCVGGALLLYHEMGNSWSLYPNFPDEHELAEVLIELTDKYDEDCADWATAIIDANDAGDFATAWAIAAKALDTSKLKQ